MSLYDTQSLHDFLSNTPEGGLRKILIDKKNMTDVHFNLLLKIVRATPASQFGEYVDKKDFPRIRMSPAETKLKEKFWDECLMVLEERGLLQPAAAESVKIAA